MVATNSASEGTMESISEQLSRAVQELLGRAAGPMHLRLILQPIMATFLAYKAGKRDAMEGNPPFLFAYATNPDQRKALRRNAFKDIAILFTIACVLDVIYQYIVLKQFHPLQTLIVAVVVAVIPYCLLRGPVTRLMRTKGS